MAFMSMVLVFLVIAAIILGALFFVGIILLVTGIIRKKRKKNEGKKSPIVQIVIGILFLIPPVGIVAFIVIGGMTSAITTRLNRLNYESVTDKWKYEWVSDDTAKQEAGEALLQSADSKDKDTFKKIFTEEIQKQADFDQQVDEFFEQFPKGLSACEWIDDGGTSSGNDEGDEWVGYTDFKCNLNGVYYFVDMTFCYKCDENTKKVGVKQFIIRNVEGQVLSDECVDTFYSENGTEKDYDATKEGIVKCDFANSTDVNARMIDGKALRFTDIPERTLTEKEIREFFASSGNQVSMKDLEEKFGSPNVSKKYFNATGYDFYYELERENNKPNYLYLSAESENGDIYDAYLCDELETDYANPIFEKN